MDKETVEGLLDEEIAAKLVRVTQMKILRDTLNGLIAQYESEINEYIGRDVFRG
jgi:hypothetical protein